MIFFFYPSQLLPALECNDMVCNKSFPFYVRGMSCGNRLRTQTSQIHKCSLKYLMFLRHWGSGQGQGNPGLLIKTAAPGNTIADTF